MSKKTFFFVALAVVLIILAFQWVYGDDNKDKRNWQTLKEELNLSIIDQITIRGIVGKPDLILEKDKAEEFLRFLKNASFDQSNRRGFGPTPEIIIELKYKDGTYLNLTTVQGILFEIQPIHIDSDSQFVIESEDLGEWLQVFREGK